MKPQTILFQIFLYGYLISCKTLAPTTHVDAKENKIILYMASDENSTLANQGSSRLGASEEILKSKTRSNPQKASAWRDLASVYLAQKKYEDARQAAVKALYLGLSDQESRIVLAKIEIERDQLGKAQLLLNGLGGVDSKNSEVLNLLGLIELRRGKLEDGFELFSRSVDLDSENVAARMNLGTIHLQFSQLEAAGVQFERVLRVVPDHSDALLHLGIVKARLGELQAAEKLYLEAQRRHPRNPILLYNLSILRMETGNYGDALDSLEAYMDSEALNTDDIIAAESLKGEIEDLRASQKRKDNLENADSMAAKLLPAKAVPANTLSSDPVDLEEGI